MEGKRIVSVDVGFGWLRFGITGIAVTLRLRIPSDRTRSKREPLTSGDFRAVDKYPFQYTLFEL